MSVNAIDHPTVGIRRAGAADAGAIAAVHVAAWRESYPGLVPAEMLADLSVEQRTDRWRRLLGEPDAAVATVAFVACAPDGEIVAFGACGLQRSPELAGAGLDGEFQAIYVLRAAQRRGIGRGLMGVMAQDLASRGLRGSALWVLTGNKAAMAFYQALGGRVVARREETRAGGTVFDEIAYAWANVALLGTAAA